MLRYRLNDDLGRVLDDGGMDWRGTRLTIDLPFVMALSAIVMVNGQDPELERLKQRVGTLENDRLAKFSPNSFKGVEISGMAESVGATDTLSTAARRRQG